MTVKLNRLRDEIDADPLALGYAGMTDQQIADSTNGLTRELVGDSQAVRNYFMLEKNRSNDVDDTVALFIFGRLEIVADAVPGADLFGSGTLATLKMITSAKTVRALVVDTQFQLTFGDARFDELLVDCRGAKIIGPADKTAIQALTANQTSRVRELGIHHRDILATHVTQAKALS